MIRETLLCLLMWKRMVLTIYQHRKQDRDCSTAQEVTSHMSTLPKQREIFGLPWKENMRNHPMQKMPCLKMQERIPTDYLLTKETRQRYKHCPRRQKESQKMLQNSYKSCQMPSVSQNVSFWLTKYDEYMTRNSWRVKYDTKKRYIQVMFGFFLFVFSKASKKQFSLWKFEFSG